MVDLHQQLQLEELGLYGLNRLIFHQVVCDLAQTRHLRFVFDEVVLDLSLEVVLKELLENRPLNFLVIDLLRVYIRAVRVSKAVFHQQSKL